MTMKHILMLCLAAWLGTASLTAQEVVADTVATATFQGADVDWYIKADDIVLKNKINISNRSTQNQTQK